MKKQAKKTTVKKAKKPTCKALNLSDFLVQPFEVNAKKQKAYQEKLKDVHTLQAFLSTANIQDVREALFVESMGRGRPDTLLRILGRLGVMTKDHFCKKLGITRPKLVKVKKAIQDTDLI